MRHFSTIGILALIICIVPFLYIPEWVERLLIVGFGAIIFVLAYIGQQSKYVINKHGKSSKRRQPYDIEDPRNQREIT